MDKYMQKYLISLEQVRKAESDLLELNAMATVLLPRGLEVPDDLLKNIEKG